MPSRRLLLAISMGALLPALTWGLAGESRRRGRRRNRRSRPRSRRCPSRRVLRHRQPDLERAFLSGRRSRPEEARRARRRVHRRRPRPELLLHRRHPPRRRLHRRRQARQSAAPPPVQVAVHAGAHAGRVPRAAARAAGAGTGRQPGRDCELARRALDKRRDARRSRLRSTTRAITLLRARVDQASARPACRSRDEDLATIDRFHRRFIEAGFDLQFQSTGRPPQSHYPTYRELLLATDASGTAATTWPSEESFQFLKSLQERDLVIPVVGRSRAARARSQRSVRAPARRASACRPSTRRTSSSICSATGGSGSS